MLLWSRYLSAFAAVKRLAYANRNAWLWGKKLYLFCCWLHSRQYRKGFRVPITFHAERVQPPFIFSWRVFTNYCRSSKDERKITESERTNFLPLVLRNWLRTSVRAGKRLNGLSSHQQHTLPCDAAEWESFASKSPFYLNRQIVRCLSGYGGSWGGGVKTWCWRIPVPPPPRNEN